MRSLGGLAVGGGVFDEERALVGRAAGQRGRGARSLDLHHVGRDDPEAVGASRGRARGRHLALAALADLEAAVELDLGGPGQGPAVESDTDLERPALGPGQRPVVGFLQRSPVLQLFVGELEGQGIGEAVGHVVALEDTEELAVALHADARLADPQHGAVLGPGDLGHGGQRGGHARVPGVLAGVAGNGLVAESWRSNRRCRRRSSRTSRMRSLPSLAEPVFRVM